MSIVSDEKYNQLDKMAGTFLVHKVIRLLKSRINDLPELFNFLEENKRFEPVNGEEKQFLGYRVRDNINFPKEIQLDGNYISIAKNFIILEYFWRKKIRRNVLGLNEDGSQKVNEETIDTSYHDYIFIIYPDILIFKGSEESFEIVWKSFFSILKRIFLDYISLSFSGNFLTYLFHKITSRQTKIDTDFYVNYLQDVQFYGRDKMVEEFIDIRNIYLPLKSNTLFLCLLERKKLKRTSIDFILKGKYITAELRDSGAFIIRQNRGNFMDWSFNERAFHGSYFIYHLLKVFKEFQNNNSHDKNYIQDITEDLVNRFRHDREN